MFFAEESERGVYFIGVGGVSMSALARLLHGRGIPVRGSDRSESEFTRELRREGIPVHIGEEEEIGEGTVVYTGAVGENQPQLAAARKAGKRVLSRAEFLGEIASSFRHTVSVAGCHGKTSTTAMLAHIFSCAGKAFTCHIGGEDAEFGNFHDRGTDWFVTEACEFRRSFLCLKSEIALILSADLDHTDCYRDENDILSAYRAFAGNAEKVVVNADDLRARSIPHQTEFGLYTGDVRAEKLCSDREKYAFTVCERGIPLVRVKLNVTGEVQVHNALAAFSAARLAGCSAEEIKRGLEEFRGVRRRFEEIGTFRGVRAISDYAHHPREIRAAIDTAQKMCPGTVRLVFQPHTYTRTRDLMPYFLDVLKRAEDPIVYRTYAAREAFDSAGSAATLAANLPDARYVQSPGQLARRLEEGLGRDDLILFLGAGDIDAIARKILDGPPQTD